MKKIRILSIDGGGMRGIIPGTVLVYLENQLIKQTGNPNSRIADYFDLVVGTSTGGILSSFYLTPNPLSDPLEPSARFSAQEALSFYVEKGNQIFNQSKKFNWFGARGLFNAARYSAVTFERELDTLFENLKMSQLLKPCVIMTYDMKAKAAFFFNSRENSSKRREFYLKDVLRSTSAAPTYFSPAKIQNLITGERMCNIDGGVFANNPALCAYAEARTTKFKKEHFPTAKNLLFLSLGTGGGGFQLPKLKRSHRWGLINWAKSIPEIMMDGSLDTVNYQMRELFGTLSKSQQDQFLRIDVPSKKREYASDMADASPKNIKDLQKAGKETLKAFKSQLDAFIPELIKNQ